MATVSVNAISALNMSAPEFYWDANRQLLPDAVQVTSGVRASLYSGDLTFGAGDPKGFIDDYSVIHNGRRTEWSVLDTHVDATTLFGLIAAGQTVAALGLMLAGDDVIFGSDRDDVLMGFGGDDLFFDRPGSDVFDGGDGHDILAFTDKSKFFTVTFTEGGASVVDRNTPTEVNHISTIEALGFADGDIEISWIESARLVPAEKIHDLTDLYTAYFNRAPDALGINYWASRLVDGMTLQQIAKSFFVQPETLAAYPPTMSTTQFVMQVYNNALGRAPDAAGLAYWVQDLESGAQTRDGFMLAIIYGARASTGSPQDAVYLRNKGAVGEYFAFTKGLGDTAWASQVMADVNSQDATVTAANAMADHFADLASTIDPHLLLPILGIHSA